MTKVIVIQESRFNYSSAEQFGDIIFATSLEYSHVPSSQINGRIISDIRKAFSDYIAGEDYIIPTGSPALCALVMASLGAKYPNAAHNVLKWDNMSHSYQLYREIENIL